MKSLHRTSALFTSTFIQLFIKWWKSHLCQLTFRLWKCWLHQSQSTYQSLKGAPPCFPVQRWRPWGMWFFLLSQQLIRINSLLYKLYLSHASVPSGMASFTELYSSQLSKRIQVQSDLSLISIGRVLIDNRAIAPKSFKIMCPHFWFANGSLWSNVSCLVSFPNWITKPK